MHLLLFNLSTLLLLREAMTGRVGPEGQNKRNKTIPLPHANFRKCPNPWKDQFNKSRQLEEEKLSPQALQETTTSNICMRRNMARAPKGAKIRLGIIWMIVLRGLPDRVNMGRVIRQIVYWWIAPTTSISSSDYAKCSKQLTSTEMEPWSGMSLWNSCVKPFIREPNRLLMSKNSSKRVKKTQSRLLILQSVPKLKGTRLENKRLSTMKR